MAEFDTVIRGGTLVNPHGRLRADLGLRAGRIVAMGEGLGTGQTEIDARDRLVMPGGVDPHAHIEQMSGMGVMNADTFETATRSAALGGTTSVISFAAQAHGQPLAQTLHDYAARAARGAMIDHAFHLSVSDVSVPGFDADLETLIAAGHRSIKVFTTYDVRLDDRAILHVLAQARAHGALVCVHAENHGMIEWARDALLAAGLVAPKYHAPSHPRAAEVESVSRICHFAAFMATPVMLFHISARESLDVISAARARGVPVWAETCPHYLMMDETVLDRPGMEGGKWMCSPPQRDPADQEALWEALARDDIHVVSSDHAPYRFDETGKLRAGPDVGFDRIANGLPGLQTRLPLLFDAMVSRGKAGGAEAFVRLTATSPAQIYGLTGKGLLAPGLDADVVIWDPNATHVYGANDLADNVGYNPWQGRTITGLPTHVLSRGELIVSEGVFSAEPGRGAWIARTGLGVAAALPPAPEVELIERHARTAPEPG